MEQNPLIRWLAKTKMWYQPAFSRVHWGSHLGLPFSVSRPRKETQTTTCDPQDRNSDRESSGSSDKKSNLHGTYLIEMETLLKTSGGGNTPKLNGDPAEEGTVGYEVRGLLRKHYDEGCHVFLDEEVAKVPCYNAGEAGCETSVVQGTSKEANDFPGRRWLKDVLNLQEQIKQYGAVGVEVFLDQRRRKIDLVLLIGLGGALAALNLRAARHDDECSTDVIERCFKDVSRWLLDRRLIKWTSNTETYRLLIRDGGGMNEAFEPLVDATALIAH